MIKTSIEKIADSIGFDIGMSDDETQANLLNGFCRALNNSMNERDLETQVCYICDKLNDGTAKIIELLYEFNKRSGK